MRKKRVRTAAALSCKKDINSRAISRNRKSSNKESEQIFKAWCQTLDWNC